MFLVLDKQKNLPEKFFKASSCLIALFVTLQEHPSLPSPSLGKILTGQFMNKNLAKSKSEALVNIFISLVQNIKLCNAIWQRQRKRPKKSLGLISKKQLHVQHSFFLLYISMPLFCTTTTAVVTLETANPSQNPPKLTKKLIDKSGGMSIQN